jgi:hypothetical protein
MTSLPGKKNNTFALKSSTGINVLLDGFVLFERVVAYFIAFSFTEF